ncbi:TetR/AcrR family transcriptional regulator [Antribacter sp. KLBMP9083]|uniref:TetR/AcrR family transcriptional regulator n=1 Tax=Antribacter soli TaxID=2910976 RepID=A0AA41QHY8_9MICO|nr:TetR/AcrR family transcriptional regulator [Antribacter soli]MCF4123066.1 TetR/AcrR family transcriptional regulator [Antribacter soli]
MTMTTEAKASTRERLLEAAATLTYREGTGVGIQALCQAAGVSKRSLYQLFDSKDELLAVSLERGAPAYKAWLLPPAGDDRSPRERILHVFGQLESQSAAPDFQGCRYLAVQIELKDPTHPASRVARGVKDDLTGFFRAEADRGGARDPDLLARQLMLIFDGASARAGVGADDLAGLVSPTVGGLLDAAGLR